MTIQLGGSEYEIAKGVAGAKYIELVRVNTPEWRKVVNRQSAYTGIDPLTAVVYHVHSLADGVNTFNAMVRIVVIAESQGAEASAEWCGDKKVWSTWEMMQYFCEAPRDQYFSHAPISTNWQRLANYAAGWLNWYLDTNG
jgi:hypothetical protein